MSSEFSPPSHQHRAFLFAYHPSHGILLLLSSKPGNPHQLPGGRVDSTDYPSTSLTLTEYLQTGSLHGSLREFNEETSIPLTPDRVTPMKMLLDPTLHTPTTSHPLVPGKYVCHEYKSRWFYTVRLSDSDFTCPPSSGVRCSSPSIDVRLNLSNEHVGFTFVKDLLLVSALIKSHSKGVPSESVIMAMRCREYERTEGKTKLIVISTDMNRLEVPSNSSAAAHHKNTKESHDTMTPLRRGSINLSDEETEPLSLPAVARGLNSSKKSSCFNIFESCCDDEGGEVSQEAEGYRWDITEEPSIPERPEGGFKKADKRVFKPRRSPKNIL
mmetsp:Transcript_1971/g.3560  ORF Transcript_1971/g.3560 Transcript_1971/m.3560 type:complete len:327 (+) Transcript_1971:133-1113(+)